MTKQFFLALFGYCMLLSSLIAQNNNSQPAISIQLSRISDVYVGVDNPVEVSVAGLSSAEYQVQTSEGSIVNTGIGKYNLIVSKPGMVTLSVFTNTGVARFKQTFRAKRIPDPVPVLVPKFSRSDSLNASQFKAMEGIALLLENFDFDVKCEMIEYKITRIGSNEAYGTMITQAIWNKGARFSTEAQEMISYAAPDDTFIFSEIKAQCPGDFKLRELYPLVIFIKTKKDD